MGQSQNDNPHFTSHPDWLPEIYSIGVRNSQGITLTPENDVFFSSHGPRGGDHIAIAQPGANFGWKHISWGGEVNIRVSRLVNHHSMINSPQRN